MIFNFATRRSAVSNDDMVGSIMIKGISEARNSNRNEHHIVNVLLICINNMC